MAMIVFAAEAAISTRMQLLGVAALLSVFSALSIVRRRAARWRWPRVGPQDIFSAALTALAISFFMLAISSVMGPQFRMLGFYFFPGGIALFTMLESLKVVYYTEQEFDTHCEGSVANDLAAAEAESPVDDEPHWKTLTRDVFGTAFLILWFCGVSETYLFGKYLHEGSKSPDAKHWAALSDHRRIVYITKAQKAILDDLQAFSWVAGPVVLVFGIVSHFLLGVKILPNVPTLQERRDKRSPEM